LQFTPISFSVELTLLWFAIPKKISSSVHILALRGYATAPNSIASDYGLRQFLWQLTKSWAFPSFLTDRRSNYASLIVLGSVVRVKRRASAATSCSTPLSSHFRAGADTGVAGRWQAGGGRHEPSRRRTETSGGGRGYPVRRWSNSKAGAGSSAGSGVGSRSALTASHSGGPRAWAI